MRCLHVLIESGEFSTEQTVAIYKIGLRKMHRKLLVKCCAVKENLGRGL